MYVKKQFIADIEPEDAMNKVRAQEGEIKTTTLWDLAIRLRALGEIMLGGTGEEILLSDAGLHGLAKILLEISDELASRHDM